MKNTLKLFFLLFLLTLLPAAAAITRNGSVSWLRTAAPGTFNASTSDKLVVVVSGEHNIAGNCSGNCSAVTYNGQALTKAVNRSPSSVGHGQTYSSIWYLDNPGNFSGAGTIAVTCNGTSWVATAIGLSGTLPGAGPKVAVSGAATAGITTNSYGSWVIAACGMGGQGNTASPLPGVTCTIPSNAVTIAGLKFGSDYTGHSVASAEIAMPSAQTIAFNTAKTDVVTVAAAFAAANPVMPAGPTPLVNDIVPGQSVELVWNNFLPNVGSNVWVDVWIGSDPANLQRVVNANPDGLNLTSTTFNAPAPGIYYGRIDSYLQGTPSDTPYAGTPFSFEVSTTGLRAETWLGLRPLASLLLLQREGISLRPPNNSLRLNGSSLVLPIPSGARLRGLLTPETSGLYKLHIAGSENTALWLSSDDSRFNKQRVASQLNATAIAEWNKSPTQTSAPIQLEAGVSYYIEAQAIYSVGNGHVEIGWTLPGATTPALIPASRLSYLPADPDDALDNNLPDSWEQSTGLSTSNLPGALTEYGDPDNDGISNLDEYQYGSDPLSKDALADGLTRDTWTNVVGQYVSSLTSNRAVFLDYPNEIVHVPGINDSERGENYGSRYRGFLIAPTTGDYHFWIAGNKKCELWLADGTVKYPITGVALSNRFGKQRIAGNIDPQSDYPNTQYDFDQSRDQRSRVIHLVQGQSYYIEVLHKQRDKDNHVEVAWQPPGQQRVLIPASAFTSDIPDDSDGDCDFLPDSWELQYGLNPADNGITDARDGQYGDWDSDGLTNLEEFQLGTDPKKADTDNDGLSDKDERDYYHTNPLVSNAIQPGPLQTVNITGYSATSVPWETLADGSIRAYERRGWVDYPFTVTPGEEGIYEVRLIGGAVGGAVRSTEKIPLSFHLDGGLIASRNMTCLLGQNTTLKQITPWLTAGNHTLRIQNHNVRADCNLRINSLSVQRLGGAGADGIPFWVQQRITTENLMTRLPASSRTSPACIEGRTSSLAGLSISRSAGVPATSFPQDILPSINNDFYTNVPLDSSAPTALSITMQNGALAFPPHSITWTPTNILAENNSTLTIRKGDSLLLTSYQGETPSGTFTLQSGAGILPAALSGLLDSASPVPVLFDTPGTHTLTATWSPTDNSTPQTAIITVTVKTADFGPAFAVQIYNRRTWTLPGVNGMDIETSTDMVWNETTAAGAISRKFTVGLDQIGTSHVIARLPETGDIIALGTLTACSVAKVGETSDAQLVMIRPDGSRVYRFTVVVENLPANAEIRLCTYFQGAIFGNGSRDLVLRASDFNSSGIKDIYIEWGDSTPHRICHTMTTVLVD